MELLKMAKTKNANVVQDVGLYYKTGMLDHSSPKIGTAFSANLNTSSPNQNQSQPQYDQSLQCSYSSNGSNQTHQSQSNQSQQSSADPNSYKCNIAVNLSNVISEQAAKQHMSLLATVLESYDCLVAGKIGNPEMTAEDYDQVDEEELELMDIKWSLASIIRRVTKFVALTGRDIGNSNNKLGFDKSKVTCFKCRQKGHFKRECKNTEASGNQSPFGGGSDYYKRALQYKPFPKKTQVEIQEKPNSTTTEKAMIASTEEEGFDWNSYIGKKTGVALMAEIVDESSSEEAATAEAAATEATAIEQALLEQYLYQQQQEEEYIHMQSQGILSSDSCASFVGHFDGSIKE